MSESIERGTIEPEISIPKQVENDVMAPRKAEETTGAEIVGLSRHWIGTDSPGAKRVVRQGAHHPDSISRKSTAEADSQTEGLPTPSSLPILFPFR